MSSKKRVSLAIRFEIPKLNTKPMKKSSKIEKVDDWLLNIPLQYISVRLDLRLQEQLVQLRMKVTLHSGCDPLNGEESLFNREIMKKQDPGNFLHRVMRHNKPTIQESVLIQILDELQLQYIPQWVLPFRDSHHVFDFLIEPNIVIECTITETKSYKAASTLRNRIVIVDRKFKTLKSFDFDSFTLILVEATQLMPEKLKPLIQYLDYTDKLVTSINEFEEFLGEWKQNRVVHENEETPEPTTEVEVPSWADKDPQSSLERFI